MYANNHQNAPKFDFPYQEQRQDQGNHSYNDQDEAKRLEPAAAAELEKVLRAASDR